MTKAPIPAPAEPVLPTEGGAWMRLKDGSLVREAPVETPVEPPVKEA